MGLWCAKIKNDLFMHHPQQPMENGENGFDDSSDDKNLSNLIPLNLYGWSKHLIDRFIWKDQKKFTKTVRRFKNFLMFMDQMNFIKMK